MELEFSGGDVLEKELLKLDQKIALKYARESGREAMKPVLADMKAGANKDKGVMEQQLKMKTTRRRGKGDKKNRFLAIQVGMLQPKGKRTRNKAAIAQEFGTSKQDAKPFMRPALKRNAQRVLDVLRTELGRKIESGK